MANVPLMFQPLVKYAVFEGRSRRSEFWLWVLFRFLLNKALGIVMMMFMAPAFTQLMQTANNPEMHAHPEQFMQTFMPAYLHMMMGVIPLFSLVSLALLLPSLAVGVRRLHDIGRTGWWIVMPYVVLFVGMIAWMIMGGASLFSMMSAHPNGDIPDAEGAKFALGFVGGLFLFVVLPEMIAWIVMLVFYVTEGKRGPNRFGPDPKGEALNNTP